MKITFDPNKDALNIQSHKISLHEAKNLESDWLIAEEDTRYSYGEVRVVGFAPIGSAVFCVVFTEENDVLRVISLRHATKREVKDYASKI